MKNNILVIVDFSYLCYIVAYNAMTHFESNYPDEFHAMIKSPDETDQSNLPNPLTNSNFKKELSKSFQNKLESIDWILRENFQAEIDLADRIDYILAIDDNLTHSFRKALFPEYKAQRKLVKKAYSFGNVRDYMIDILLPELNRNLNNKYIPIKIEGAEGDDVVASVSKIGNDDYNVKVVIGSDRDFLQLDNIRLFDVFGNEKVREAWKGGPVLSPKQYLLAKIIRGDSSDNISNIKRGFGEKKAYKLATNVDELKTILKEDDEVAKQFILNRKLISFDMIPKELEEKIISEANSKLLIRANTDSSIKQLNLDSITDINSL